MNKPQVTFTTSRNKAITVADVFWHEQRGNKHLKVNIQQDTPEWHEFRRGGIGASEIAAALGKSQYESRYDLWLRKTGRVGEKESNYAMERGKALEDVARKAYIDTVHINIEPVVYKLGFLFASCDGYSIERDLVVEIKCPMSTRVISQAKDGEVQKEYVYQVQQQMLCTGAKIAHVWVWDDKRQEGHLVPIVPCEKKQQEIRDGGAEFWSHVVSGKPPQPSKTDYVALEDSSIADMVLKYQTLTKKEAEIKAQKELLQEALKKAAGDLKRVQCLGFKWGKFERKGQVDYSKIEALKNLDLDQYRKNDIEYWKFG